MPWWSKAESRTAADVARLRPLAELNARAAAHLADDQPDPAVPLLEEAVAGCRERLGHAHPDTLTVAGNLGVAYVRAGRWSDGLDLLAANRVARTRVFGEDDPRTLTASDALATAYRLAGRTDDALDLAGTVTAERRRTLGPAHPDTLTSRMGMALARAATGDVESAATLLRAALNDAEHSLGLDRKSVV